jgi:ADP-heptose:LPS heptosyltransferase
MKVLVLYSSSVQEAIFLSPVIRALKVQFDPPEIHAFVPAKVLPSVEDNPYIDKITIADNAKIIPVLRKEQYDYVIDCTGGGYARLVCAVTATRRLTYPRQEWEEWLMTKLGINKMANANLAERMLRILEPLGIRPDDLGLDYFIPERDRVPRSWLPPEFQPGYVVFFISAPFATRRLPTNRMIELCDKINRPVVLLGHTKDREEATRIQQFFQPGKVSEPFETGLNELNKKTRIFNGVGSFNQNQRASLTKYASYVFTFDNEMVPIASAFSRHVVLIMGNTIPLFGRFPYRTKFTVLEVAGLPCRPCSAGGFTRCPRGHFRCMKEIVFDFYL